MSILCYMGDLRMRGSHSVEGQGHKTTGTFGAGPQGSKNKGTGDLENWPCIFFLCFRVWQWHVFRNLGQMVFEVLWSTEHDMVRFSMFTNTFWTIYITIYIKIKLWTAGQEHWSTRRTFFQVPWHRGLPMACQWRVWFPSESRPSPEQRRLTEFMAGGWQSTHTVYPSRRYCIHRVRGRFSRAQWGVKDSVLNSIQYPVSSVSVDHRGDAACLVLSLLNAEVVIKAGNV